MSMCAKKCGECGLCIAHQAQGVINEKDAEIKELILERNAAWAEKKRNGERAIRAELQIGELRGEVEGYKAWVSMLVCDCDTTEDIRMADGGMGKTVISDPEKHGQDCEYRKRMRDWGRTELSGSHDTNDPIMCVECGKEEASPALQASPNPTCIGCNAKKL